MKVLVTGAQGMLGQEVCRSLGATAQVVGLGHAELDVTELAQVRAALKTHQPGVVVHCAAWTDVDGCERDPERALAHNTRGTWNVALACREHGCRLTYISTDYVFDGEKGSAYVESDAPRPINVYGATKLAGESLVQGLVPQHLVVRSAWIFAAHSRNFVRTIRHLAAERAELRVVADQVGSPTYAPDLARAIAELVAAGATGVRHVANRGQCSWAELAQEVVRLTGGSARVLPISAAEWGAPARRPAFSALTSEWGAEAGFALLRSWREALRECLAANALRAQELETARRAQ